jgi:hypothetical protein
MQSLSDLMFVLQVMLDNCDKEEIDIRYILLSMQLFDDLKDAMEGMLAPK